MDGVHPDARQRHACQLRQVAQEFARHAGQWHERAGRLGAQMVERSRYFRTHFEMTRPDTGAQPGRQLVGTGCTHRCDRRFQHAAGQAAPAGMRGPDHFAVRIGQQHRHAIGRHDHAHSTRSGRDTGVGLRCVAHRCGIEHPRAMDLRQPGRLGRQQASQPRTIGRNSVGRIRHMHTQVQPAAALTVVIRRDTDTAAALRGQRTNGRRQSRPLRHDHMLGQRRSFH